MGRNDGSVDPQILHNPNKDVSGILTVLLRGARKRCPRCSKGLLYERWNVFRHHCENCGFQFEEREGNCWFLLYTTTAALTGLFIIGILVWRPENLLLGRSILTISSFCVITLSLPARKGIALALEFLSESKGSRYEENANDNE
jgi:uncharacterized protein (DUF983 family)